MALQHLDRRQQRCPCNFTGVEVGGNYCLRLLRILANNSSRILAAECPPALARLLAGTGRYVPLAPADTAVRIASLDENRRELGECAIRKHVRTDQGQSQ